MIFSAVVYTFLILAIVATSLQKIGREMRMVLLALVGVLVNLPIIYHLSIVEWIVSFLATPSVFLGVLAVSSLIVTFYAPKEVLLPPTSKIFIVIFGFVLYLGSLNLLFGFDLTALNFEYQIVIASIIMLFAFVVDKFLGIVYLICFFFFCLGIGENIFVSMIDVLVWGYAIFGIFLDGARKKAHQRF
ncbi:hypothetical protein BBW65_03755 [Helicobacter enhydrae]|uniref:Uncharacterized protein n=2 Tax=Helicobacter enhydrae TaxID=222136 RepID=A0A1B1U595_9HELI|nr:hypothetical protein BBW65_03755 [Helicobacter enhydrae]